VAARISRAGAAARRVRGGAAALAVMLAAAWPAPAAADEALYERRCAVCHGARGRGDGPAAAMLSPPPRDFATGVYKFRSTPPGTLPTSADVARTIRHGLAGTSMPAFADLLSPREIDGLARHVLALAPAGIPAGEPIGTLDAPGGRGGTATGPTGDATPAVPGGLPGEDRPGTAHGHGAGAEALRPGEVGARGAGAVARGAVLYREAGCASCHGVDGRGTGWRPEREGAGGERAPTDLSEPWAFRGGHDERAVARRILAGAGAMPSYAGSLSPAEARDVARYVATLARRPAWEETDPAAVARAGVAEDPVDRGRYLVRAMQCPLCHTPIDAATGAYDAPRFLAGGMRVSAYPWGVWYSRNLTPDEATGLGGWSEDEIVAAVTRGLARDGRRLDPMAMPWPWFSRLTPSDARAIAVYLGRLAPVANAVPAPERIPVAERAGGKLLALLGADVAVEFWGGNAAADASLTAIPAPAARRLAARAAGWGTLGAAAGLLAFGALRRRRLAVVGAAALAAWVALAVWPPLALVPPEATVRWLLAGRPALPASVTGAERALAERGEYLVTVAPCGLCHTPVSPFVGFLGGRALAGGMEGRWRVYGSAVSTNLRATPPPPPAPALRALRSGIGADGRALHWQAMPWDIVSNWSEEDLRAMLAYLDALPRAPGTVPAPRPPRPGDPPADSFFFGDAARR
jgi:mono/diheme cytochrome c family protein